MSIFDKLKSTAKQAVNSAAQSIGSKQETFTFTSLPESLAQMQALPEASLDTPFKTAALTVLALCAYAADKGIGTEMLNWLRGPRPLNGQELEALELARAVLAQANEALRQRFSPALNQKAGELFRRLPGQDQTQLGQLVLNGLCGAVRHPDRV